MRVLHWCMLGVTLLLLGCQVVISQMCHSLIMLADSFHTLLILTRMALNQAGVKKPPLSSSDSPAPPPHASSSSSAAQSESFIKPLPGTQTPTDGSTVLDQHQPELSPPALDCSLAPTNCRIQSVGTFVSALFLASLCLSYILEIVPICMEPKPIKRPLLLVVVTTVSLLHKMLMLWLNLDHQQAPETESHVEVNHKVLDEEEAKGEADPGRVLSDVSHTVQSAAEASFHNTALVLCNPGTSCIPDTDSPTPEPQSGGDSEDITEISKDKTCSGHLASQKALNTSPVSEASIHIRSPVLTSQWKACLSSFAFVLVDLCTPLLALITNLVLLLMGPQCLQSQGTCRLIIYLDPGLTMLAVIVLGVAAMPQVHRYGLLLLQATPPHICVTDLRRRIASVPGVQGVHDLHVWQESESFIVATVHVHCHGGFPAHRCSDLMSGVTKVLRSVGVSSCTVQPEFVSCSAGSMCCSPLEDETSRLLAPPAGETKEEPQTLVIENTYL
ncbi:proton-coupled zinc antiporter SLC30A1 [Pagrus major]|uniref:proton-coupled zinc antiporter SLC30A1 n=1 Tax=Pagrus major TaxID=143350 RepID=UPI003CC8A4DC